MKHRKNILYIALLTCLMACQDDLGVNNGMDGEGSLNLCVGMTDDFTQSRADGIPQFQKGTLFHVYGTHAPESGESWSVNYLRDDHTGNTVAKGVADSEAQTVKVDEDATCADFKIASMFHAKPMNFYGMTVVDKDEVAANVTANNALLEGYLTTSEADVPQYLVKHEGDAPLPDVMWSGSLKGLTPRENSGKVVMPFTHTFSKLNFYAMLANGETADIKIKSLSLTDYPEGKLSMADGLYKRTATDATRSVNVQAAGYADGREVLVTEAVQDMDNDYVLGTPFATSLIFPTTDMPYLARDKNGNLLDEQVSVPENNPVHVQLTILNGNTQKVFDLIELSSGETAQAFRPNVEYDVIFILTSNSVVMTLRPRYFEYIEEPIDLGEYEVGEPIDFGGMMWAAANLGATSANPTANALEWEKARGFYYQFGRNIPFYARGSVQDAYSHVATVSGNQWVSETIRPLYTDGKQPNVNIPYSTNASGLGNVTNHCARPYPYIPVLWEKYNNGGEEAYKSFLKDYVGQMNLSETRTLHSDPYWAADTSIPATAFAFSVYNSGTHYRDWTNNHTRSRDNWGTQMNQPCPKGWRLPTRQEFLSVFPVDANAGDISFNASGGTGAYLGDAEPDSERKGRLTARIYEYPKPGSGKVLVDYQGLPAQYIGIYQDGLKNNNLKEIDGAAEQGWGTIYAIKCLGTDDAYAVRWQVKVIDSGGKDLTGRTVSRSHTHGTSTDVGRAVVVISKYEFGENKSKVRLGATRTTHALATAPTNNPSHTCFAYVDKDGNGSYNETKDEKVSLDWDRPAGEIYFPITGYFITTYAGTGQGLIYAGSEVLYWTATASEYNGHPYAVSARMKFAGSYEDRYLYIAPHDMRGYGANVRCVRDTKVIE